MSQSASDEFDAAKIIVDALKGLDQQQQDRAIRFASESVGLQLPAHRPASFPGAANTGSSVVEAAQPAGQNLVDIKQFVDSKSPKSDQQFATVVAYYYRFVSPAQHHKESINAEDLKNAARLVGRKQPGDASATLHNAKNSGYLDSVAKGAFQINSVGENLVAITLPGDDTEPKPKRSNREKKKKAVKTASKKRPPKSAK
jgi:hypothetical protein